MFINKSHNGTNNVIGERLADMRKETGLSQKKFADRLQLLGLDVDKNAIQRIECGKRFVTDIELVYFCRALETDPNSLLKWKLGAAFRQFLYFEESLYSDKRRTDRQRAS